MAKMIDCSKVDPTSGCKHITFGNDCQEVLRRAAEHAKEHGILRITPEMMQRAQAAIQDCPWILLEMNSTKLS